MLVHLATFDLWHCLKLAWRRHYCCDEDFLGHVTTSPTSKTTRHVRYLIMLVEDGDISASCLFL